MIQHLDFASTLHLYCYLVLVIAIVVPQELAFYQGIPTYYFKYKYFAFLNKNIHSLEYASLNLVKILT